ncbi:MAG: hypothetical protein ACXWZS_04105, partial [Gemmatirosa sp.]
MKPVRSSRALRTLAVAGVAFAAPVPAAHAQVTLNADLVLANAFVWRGLTFTNRPVLQPDAYLTVAAGAGTFVTGAALNVEPVAYRGAHDLSVLGAESGTLVTATTLWGEYARPVGIASATLGVAGYVYPRAAGIAASYNTVEVYAKGALAAPLSPTLAIYYDVGQVRGAYAEAGLRHAIAATRRVSLAVAGTAGVSAGQGANGDGVETAYFVANGLTHVDLALTATWTASRVTVAPSVHAIVDRDAATQLTSPGERHRVKALVGLALGWAAPLVR